MRTTDTQAPLSKSFMKILILASNPRRDLNLDREIRDLKAVIEKSRNRQDFEVEDALAVRVGDLQDLFLKHQPQIVHFLFFALGAIKFFAPIRGNQKATYLWLSIIR